MASKRIPTPSPSSSSNPDGEGSDRDVLDTSIFVNLSAQHHYLDVLIGKSFIQERGFKPGREDGKHKDQIISHGWTLVVAKPVSAPMSVVREFYVNTLETQNGISYMRGKQVIYTKQAINELFHVDTLPSGATNWAESQRFETDLDKLIKKLCKPGTKWTTKAGTDRKVHFPQTTLSRYAKVWYSFICASVLPTSHHTDVITDRAILLYGIIKGKSIDIRHIINQSMLRYMKGEVLLGESSMHQSSLDCI